MKRFNTARPTILAALACAVAWTSGVLAQEQPISSPAPMHGHHDPAAMRQHTQEKRAERLKALHDALNIKPDQETAFSAYAAAMSPPPGADGRRHDHKDGAGEPGALTTPQRLDQMAQRMDDRITRIKQAFQRRATATKALYAALRPDQQRTMDALHGLIRHDGARMGGLDRTAGHGGWGSGPA